MCHHKLVHSVCSLEERFRIATKIAVLTSLHPAGNYTDKKLKLFDGRICGKKGHGDEQPQGVDPDYVSPPVPAPRLTASRRRLRGTARRSIVGRYRLRYDVVGPTQRTLSPAACRKTKTNCIRFIAMIHGYHVILPMYGFWLPNDPRGSRSDFVRRWEIAKFGRATKSLDRTELSEDQQNLREATRKALTYPSASINGQHPLQQFAEADKRPPRMWSAHERKVYLDSEEAIENAIQYVEDIPEKEGRRKQKWSLVSPFDGLPKGGWTTYHRHKSFSGKPQASACPRSGRRQMHTDACGLPLNDGLIP